MPRASHVTGGRQPNLDPESESKPIARSIHPIMILNRTDLVVLGSILVVCTAVSLVLRGLWKEASLPALVIVGITLLAALQLEMYRRLSRCLVLLARNVDRKIEDDGRLNFHQVEALGNLLAVITPNSVLPPTRDWAVWPDFLRTLYVLILERRPKLILELGSGVSTLLAAYALKRSGGGRIVSLDHLAHYAETTRKTVAQHGLEHDVLIIHAPLKMVGISDREALWYDPTPIESLQDIDLLVVDGPPGHVQRDARYPALPLLFDKLAKDAIILIDDANRPDEKRMVQQWLAEFDCFEAEFLNLGQGAYVLQRKPVDTVVRRANIPMNPP
jgi:predicted O-methyltransferase YrrM